jgi:hypothetical protein
MSTTTLLIVLGVAAFIAAVAVTARFAIRRLRLFVRNFWPHS